MLDDLKPSVLIQPLKKTSEVFLPGTVHLQHFVRLWLLLCGKDKIKPEESPEAEEEDNRASKLS